MISFFDLFTLEGSVKCSGGSFIFGKKEHSASGAVESVSGIDFETGVVAHQFHGDNIVRLRVICGVDEVAGLLVDRNDPFILEKDAWLGRGHG